MTTEFAWLHKMIQEAFMTESGMSMAEQQYDYCANCNAIKTALKNSYASKFNIASFSKLKFCGASPFSISSSSVSFFLVLNPP